MAVSNTLACVTSQRQLLLGLVHLFFFSFLVRGELDLVRDTRGSTVGVASGVFAFFRRGVYLRLPLCGPNDAPPTYFPFPLSSGEFIPGLLMGWFNPRGPGSVGSGMVDPTLPDPAPPVIA